MSNQRGKRRRQQRLLALMAGVGLASAIAVGLIGFITEMTKKTPDPQVLASYVSLMTTPLLVAANVLYSRDRGDDDE